jgi:UMP-CMP kinase
MISRITERGRTSGQADDNPETIKKRLGTFTNETVPVVHDFENRGKAIKVNA